MNISRRTTLAIILTTFSAIFLAFIFYQNILPLNYAVGSISLIAISGLLWYRTLLHSRRQLAAQANGIQKVIKTKFFDDGIKKDELCIDDFNNYFDNAINYVAGIGSGNLNVHYGGMTAETALLNDANLAGAILKMKDKLVGVAEEERQRHWNANGLAKFSSIARDQNRKFDLVLNDFLSQLVSYISANQGGIFILNDDKDDPALELKACWAYNRKKFVERTLRPGEGLVGQTFLEGELVLLKDVPKDYISITSGLGEALPRCVVLVPLKNNEDVVGILEIASFEVWEKFQLDFLMDIGKLLGSVVHQIRSAEATKTLLEESQMQALQLRSQEEELRQNVEELNATQEAVARKSQEAVEQNSRLSAVLDSTDDAIITLNGSGILESVNLAGGRLFNSQMSDIVGRHIRNFIPDSDELAWDNFSKIIRRRIQSTVVRKDGSSVPVEVYLNETTTEALRIITVIISDISARIKSEEDQKQYIEELRAQEEELRQNMEELSATQEEINRQLVQINTINGELDARVAALNSSTIMSEADIYGTIKYINEKFCEVSQFTQEELLGKPHKVVRHPDMPSEVFKQMWKTIKSGKVFRGIVKNRKKDGTHYWVDAVISPVLDENNLPVKYIGVRYVIEDEDLAQKLFDQQLEKLGISVVTTK